MLNLEDRNRLIICHWNKILLYFVMPQRKKYFLYGSRRSIWCKLNHFRRWSFGSMRNVKNRFDTINTELPDIFIAFESDLNQRILSNRPCRLKWIFMPDQNGIQKKQNIEHIIVFVQMQRLRKYNFFFSIQYELPAAVEIHFFNVKQWIQIHSIRC